MKKALLAALALAVLGIGGYFGLNFWSKEKVRGEVEQAFTSLRASGTQASHGEIAFDLPNRTLSVADIAITAGDGSSTVKIARLTATGIAPPSGGRITADSVTLHGVEVRNTDATRDTTYETPLVEIAGYSGPAAFILPPIAATSAATLRAGLQHFAAMRAASIRLPHATARVRLAAMAATPRTPGTDARSFNVDYGALLAEGIGQGRIAHLSLDRVGVREQGGAQAAQGFVGTLEQIDVTAIDTAPLLALTQASTQGQPAPTGYMPLYGRLSAGSYSLTQDGGATVMMSNILAEGIALDPGLLNLARLEALDALSKPDHALTAAEVEQLTHLTSDVLKGIGFARISTSNASLSSPGGKMELANLALTGYAAGKLERMQVDGFIGHSGDASVVALGSGTVNGLSLVAMMDLAPKTARQGADPTADTVLALFKVLDGFEFADLTVPEPELGGTVSVGHFAVAWDQFIGAVPTRFKLRARDITGPISEADGAPFNLLVAAGMTSATLSFTLDTTYDQGAQAIVIGPVSAQVDDALKVSLDARLTRIPPAAFENAGAALGALDQAGLGPVKLELVDLGAAELALRAYVDLTNGDIEQMRTALIAVVQEQARAASADFPNAERIGAALVQFLKTPKTLTLTLNPTGDVKLLDLAQTDDPLATARQLSLDLVAGP
ncbi:hypothetical protein [Roseixanthobacter glucoisosaccharinicivorans]|uniref:hypothetical protein n=1 Tax=Roseixanthobacter glucoisosaccharinicivorans TaxID=3119923 RepID=UPI00372BF802